ncbi:hypothetical protein MHK_009851 [Candidatus Magnetomorum sp. HK-1]|nr:hypothetical protein MHK_009851 [Candidatus Magnetomorum sp. HK-1]
MTDEMFKELDKNVTRKDFFIMLMKAPQFEDQTLTDKVPLNPYEDESFLKKLYQGDTTTNTPINSFDDLDQYYPDNNSSSQKLSFPVEVNGVEKREFRPFESIQRIHAIAKLGQIYRSLYKKVLKEDYRINEIALTKDFISNTTSLSIIKSILDPIFNERKMPDTDNLYR